MLASFVVAGILAACVWVWVWTPPMGVVVDGEFFLDDTALNSGFAGTGSYVLIALAAGALLGGVTAALLVEDPPRALAVGLAGSLLAGTVMALLGPMLGPDDPALLARDLPDRSELAAGLTLGAWGAWLAFPVGTLVGLLVGWWLLPGRAGRPDHVAPAEVAGPVDRVDPAVG